MKRIVLILLAICVCLSTALSLVACNTPDSSESGSGSNATSENGQIYYAYEDNKTDKSLWMKLDNGKWTDDDGFNGTYTIEGDHIEFFHGSEGKAERILTGTIVDGKIEVSNGFFKYVYYLDGKAPDANK